MEHVDISDLPLMGVPSAIEAFRDRVCSADCFLFGSPENYSITSTYSPAPPPS
jgi:NAD(P)H-dependent FMN reductase